MLDDFTAIIFCVPDAAFQIVETLEDKIITKGSISHTHGYHTPQNFVHTRTQRYITSLEEDTLLKNFSRHELIQRTFFKADSISHALKAEFKIDAYWSTGFLFRQTHHSPDKECNLQYCPKKTLQKWGLSDIGQCVFLGLSQSKIPTSTHQYMRLFSHIKETLARPPNNIVIHQG
jgi:hypothetical protein